MPLNAYQSPETGDGGPPKFDTDDKTGDVLTWIVYGVLGFPITAIGLMLFFYLYAIATTGDPKLREQSHWRGVAEELLRWPNSLNTLLEVLVILAGLIATGTCWAMAVRRGLAKKAKIEPTK